ncbi:MAG: transcriptional regulator SpxA [Bacillaceae bacterium]
MVTLYTSSSCGSCRKAKAWLEQNGVSYKEKNVFRETLSINEIQQILQLTENGTEEVISLRSKAFEQLNIDLDSISLSSLYNLIQNHPTLLKRPILKDDKRLQVGYNEEEIRSFLPREARKFKYVH